MLWDGESFIYFSLHKENNDKIVQPQEPNRQHSAATKVLITSFPALMKEIVNEYIFSRMKLNQIE